MGRLNEREGRRVTSEGEVHKRMVNTGIFVRRSSLQAIDVYIYLNLQKIFKKL